MNISRNEYPRPQFRRDDWTPLNGEWEFAFDDDNKGIKTGYQNGGNKFPLKINVPFSYQYPASGINSQEKHEIVWYKRTFKTKEAKDERTLLCFNGCDYVADVWVNGYHAITHKGAYSAFSVDITDYLNAPSTDNVIVVRCYDPYDPTIPRGKQSWTGDAFTCWYIPNTGIWQSVWLEYFKKDCIIDYSIFPDIDTLSFSGEITTLHQIATECEIRVLYKDKQIKKMRFSLDGKYTRYTVRLMEQDFVGDSCFWSPECPNLFYVDFVLYANDEIIDIAHTRFGMRKISIDNSGVICLNNSPLYQRLVLDQGYFAESGITPPSVDAIRKDIQLSIDMGFNGARKHQKIEDPYFYYLAEEMGFLTWCEMPSAYNFNVDEVMNITNEWQEILKTARNFTSNVCYVPLNESWGARRILVDKKQQSFARSLYFSTKSIDDSKLISTNDGWENIDDADIISIHDYAYDKSDFAKKYNKESYDSIYPQGRKLMCSGNNYSEHPVLFTEFGGIAMQKDKNGTGWGYNTGAKDDEEFFARYSNLIQGIYETSDFQGFCYTQLTDVQQEVNGLLTEDRTCKFDLERVKKITLNSK